MTESKAYRLVKFEELLALRQAAAHTEIKTAHTDTETDSTKHTEIDSSEPEVDVDETSESESATTVRNEAPPANGKMPRPVSLRGMSYGEIKTLEIDGNLSPVEQDFLRSRKGPPIDLTRYGDHAWMLF